MNTVARLTASIACAAVSTAVACEPKPAQITERPVDNAAGSASSSPAPTAPAAGGASCQVLAQAAKAKVVPRIEQSRACSADADCVTIGVATRCFDMCTRAIAVSGKAAVSAALADADASCAEFIAAGCKAVIPPCLPPPNATCVQGKCTQ